MFELLVVFFGKVIDCVSGDLFLGVLVWLYMCFSDFVMIGFEGWYEFVMWIVSGGICIGVVV